MDERRVFKMSTTNLSMFAGNTTIKIFVFCILKDVNVKKRIPDQVQSSERENNDFVQSIKRTGVGMK